MNPNRNFTIKEIAARNNLSVDTIERRIRRRELPLADCRDRRFKRPAQFRAASATRVLLENGYEVPED